MENKELVPTLKIEIYGKAVRLYINGKRADEGVKKLVLRAEYIEGQGLKTCMDIENLHVGALAIYGR